MGLGDWVKDKAGDLKEGINDAGDWVQDKAEDGAEWVGKGIDKGSDVVADGLDKVGLETPAEFVRDVGDGAADKLGADVAERELGQTEDPKELIHGEPETINGTVKHLGDFATAFGDAARGLKGIEASGWTGNASEGYDGKMRVQPGRWQNAADACGKAKTALDDYSRTVTWAQGRTKDAIAQYEKGRKASESAVKAFNAKVTTYNNAVESGTPKEQMPEHPGEFVDPGKADMEAAQHTLDNARKERDRQGSVAASAIRAATALAPEKPEFTDRMMGNAQDAWAVSQSLNQEVGEGALKSLAGIAGFVRSVNPTDPYNLTHPAEYLQTTSKLARGLVYARNHPDEALKAMVGSGWTSNPAEAAGRLLPDALATLASGGGGAALKGARTLDNVGDMAGAANKIDDGARVADNGAAAVRGTADETPSSRPDGCKDACQDPVDASTGAVFLHQSDLTLPGVLPVLIEREHLSTFRYGKWFGPTWASTLDERLDIDEDGVVHVGPAGVLLAYEHPDVDGETLPRHGPRWPLRRTETGGYVLTEPDTGVERHFFGHTEGFVSLVAVRDPFGNRISIARNRLGAPVEVRHTGGYRVLVESSASRVVALHVADDDESPWDGALRDEDEVPGTCVMRYRYDEQGHLAEVVNSSDLALRFSYDDHGRLTRWVDRNGAFYFYEYDDEGRCVDQAGDGGALGATYEYLPDPDRPGGRITRMTDQLGATTTFHVNDAWQVERIVDPLGHVSTREWDERNRLLAATDPLGRTTRIDRDERGRPLVITRPDGSQQRFAYPNDGEPGAAGYDPITVELPDGSRWRNELDDHGRRVATIDPTGAVTRYGYDERGRLSEVTDPLDAVTRIVCNDAGLPVEVVDPTGAVTAYERDPLGRVVATTDAAGERTTLTWTDEGWLASRMHADGSTESWTYDGEGNVVSAVDRVGRETRNSFGAFDQLAAQTTPDGGTTRFEYDQQLRLVAVHNPAGLTWRYEYDDAGRLVAETDFNGRRQTLERDAAGQVVRQVNGAGEALELGYDRLGNLTDQRAPGDRLTVFAHDPLGRLVRATTAEVDVVWERDAVGRVLAESVNGRSLVSTYDLAGRRTSRTTPEGVRTDWAYDAAGRVEGVDLAGRQIRFGRDAAGREVQRALAGGAVVEQTYAVGSLPASQRLTVGAGGSADPGAATARRLEQMMGGGRAEDLAPAETLLAERAWSWSAGELVGVSDAAGDRRFDVDGLGRVTAVTGSAGQVEEYGYDASGNQIAARWGSEGVDGEGDREFRGTLLVRDGRGAGGTRFRYDAQGRLVERVVTRLSRKPEVWRYSWDAQDRMTGLVTPNGVEWRYVYDALGRRVAKQRLDVDGSVTAEKLFCWDGTVLVEESDTVGSAPRSSRSWVHQGTRPVAQVDSQEEVDAAFFGIVTDLVGAPTEVVDEAGELVWRAQANVWGAPEGVDAGPVPLRFPGQYADAESGLFYNVLRYYDPATARFVSQDPLGLAPAANPSAYVDNPLTWSDPLGLAPCGVSGDDAPDADPGAANAVRYGPHNPGPLVGAIASTFRSSSYTMSELSEATTLYRVYGGQAGELGSYWTRTKPAGPLQSQLDSALNPAWGNTASSIATIRVPAGTTIYEGAAASQPIAGGGSLLGGGSQVYVPRVDPAWLVP